MNIPWLFIQNQQLISQLHDKFSDEENKFKVNKKKVEYVSI